MKSSTNTKNFNLSLHYEHSNLVSQDQLIQRRIVSGKLSEKLGDTMLHENALKREELEELIETTNTEIINLQCVISASEFMGAEAVEVNSADEAIKLIHESITNIYAEKPAKNSRQGTLTYVFKNGLKREFHYMSDSHKVFENGVEVQYPYAEHV